MISETTIKEINDQDLIGILEHFYLFKPLDRFEFLAVLRKELQRRFNLIMGFDVYSFLMNYELDIKKYPNKYYRAFRKLVTARDDLMKDPQTNWVKGTIQQRTDNEYEIKSLDDYICEGLMGSGIPMNESGINLLSYLMSYLPQYYWRGMYFSAKYEINSVPRSLVEDTNIFFFFSKTVENEIRKIIYTQPVSETDIREIKHHLNFLSNIFPNHHLVYPEIIMDKLLGGYADVEKKFSINQSPIIDQVHVSIPETAAYENVRPTVVLSSDIPLMRYGIRDERELKVCVERASEKPFNFSIPSSQLYEFRYTLEHVDENAAMHTIMYYSGESLNFKTLLEYGDRLYLLGKEGDNKIVGISLNDRFIGESVMEYDTDATDTFRIADFEI